MEAPPLQLTEKQVALWLRLQDACLELHEYSFHIRFDHLRPLFVELVEITENTKDVNGQTFNHLIFTIGVICCEIIYRLQIDQIRSGLHPDRYPKGPFHIFSEIYRYRASLDKSDPQNKGLL